MFPPLYVRLRQRRRDPNANRSLETRRTFAARTLRSESFPKRNKVYCGSLGLIGYEVTGVLGNRSWFVGITSSSGFFCEEFCHFLALGLAGLPVYTGWSKILGRVWIWNLEQCSQLVSGPSGLACIIFWNTAVLPNLIVTLTKRSEAHWQHGFDTGTQNSNECYFRTFVRVNLGIQPKRTFARFPWRIDFLTWLY